MNYVSQSVINVLSQCLPNIITKVFFINIYATYEICTYSSILFVILEISINMCITIRTVFIYLWWWIFVFSSKIYGILWFSLLSILGTLFWFGVKTIWNTWFSRWTGLHDPPTFFVILFNGNILQKIYYLRLSLFIWILINAIPYMILTLINDFIVIHLRSIVSTYCIYIESHWLNI